jgi:hypothetical protein
MDEASVGAEVEGEMGYKRSVRQEGDGEDGI